MRKKRKAFTKTSAMRAANPAARVAAMLDMLGAACRALRADGFTWLEIERRLHLEQHNGMTAYNLAKRKIAA